MLVWIDVDIPFKLELDGITMDLNIIVWIDVGVWSCQIWVYINSVLKIGLCIIILVDIYVVVLLLFYNF